MSVLNARDGLAVPERVGELAMSLFAKPSEPPPPSDGAMAYVLWTAREWQGAAKAQPDSAICQDLGIFGDDVDDFALKLAERYGDWVADWPWQRFADLSEPHLFTAPLLLWRVLMWPLRGRVWDLDPYERLELAHIAKVLETGEWLDP